MRTPDTPSTPEQAEPVAYIRVGKTGNVMACAKTGDFYKLPDKTLLYTAPPPPQHKLLSEVLLTDKIVERAGREWWAQTRHTNGPRTLSAYASQTIMDEVHDTARIILTAAIQAAHGIKAS